jgi:mono/diheme cytochrome c family protein
MKPTFHQLIILLLILTLGLAACAQAAETNNTASNPAPEEPANQQPTDQPEEADEPETAKETPAEEPAPEPTEEQTTASGGVSFSADVMPILMSRCITCHGGDRIEAELVMLDYDNLMKGSENGPVIIAGDAANSYLVELIESQKMPKRGPKLTPPQVQTIIDWINQGALNN